MVLAADCSRVGLVLRPIDLSYLTKADRVEYGFHLLHPQSDLWIVCRVSLRVVRYYFVAELFWVLLVLLASAVRVLVSLLHDFDII